MQAIMYRLGQVGRWLWSLDARTKRDAAVVGLVLLLVVMNARKSRTADDAMRMWLTAMDYNMRSQALVGLLLADDGDIRRYLNRGTFQAEWYAPEFALRIKGGADWFYREVEACEGYPPGTLKRLNTRSTDAKPIRLR